MIFNKYIKCFIGVSLLVPLASTFAEVLIGTSSANIQQTIQLNEEVPLNFATIIPGNLADQIVITESTEAGTISSTTGNSVLTGTFTQGKFTITGVPDSLCNVSIDVSTLLSGPGEDMIVDNLIVNRSAPNLGPEGETEIIVGGTLNINANQLPGLYSGTYNINVTYQ